MKYTIKDMLMGIPKSDLLGVTVALMHVTDGVMGWQSKQVSTIIKQNV